MWNRINVLYSFIFGQKKEVKWFIERLQNKNFSLKINIYVGANNYISSLGVPILEAETLTVVTVPVNVYPVFWSVRETLDAEVTEGASLFENAWVTVLQYLALS